MVITLVGGILALVYRDYFDKDVEKLMKNIQQNYDKSESARVMWDAIQKEVSTKRGEHKRMVILGWHATIVI